MQRAITLSERKTVNLMRVLPTAAFLAVLLSGAVLTLLNFPALPRGDENLVKGGWTAALETKINESVGFRPWAIDTWGVLEYGLFRNGRPGVIVGADGWLFTDEEFTYHPDETVQTADKLAAIVAVRERLAAQGIDLVLALVPAKARVYEDKLGRYRLPDYTHERYESFRQALLAEGVAAPDLLTPMMAAKTEGDVFVRTDTHWTPYGARTVAETLAAALAPLNEGSFTTDFGDMLAHEGDLLSFIPLGPFEAIGPGSEPVRLEQTHGQVGGALGLFGDVSIPVALVGTSYSADETWNFAGALKTALQADVLNAAQEGKGPLRPMQDYLANDALRDSPPRLLVWEFPERFIPVAYDVELQ